ncbi:MAG: FAD-binding oxidoreductase [Sphingomonadales bacterium]|nr:FAD-binding oxidoreductase [Sphingomonadales bacterium]
MSIPESVIAALKAAVGPKGAIQDPTVKAAFLTEWRERYVGATPLIVMPASVEELVEVVKICAEAGVPMVPQGGNTGLVAGQIPHESSDQLLINLSRMNKIIAVDAKDFSLAVEAGATLAAVQDAAAEADRLFPLSLASEGTTQIGGLIATNAGGVNVLRYGSMRALVLGLEAVLPDGRIFDGMTSLHKDNTGYDLKQLLVGSEGTLGIVTKAVLKLFPATRDRATAFLAVPDPAAAVRLLGHLREASGDRLTALELMPRIGLEMVLAHIPGTRDPLAEASPWYVLAEVGSPAAGSDLAEVLEGALADALASDLVTDGVVAKSDAEHAALWKLRHAMSEAQKPEGGSIKHDVSVAIARIPELIAAGTRAAQKLIPGIRPVPFGHLGDGNIHFNFSQPKGMDRDAYLAHWEELNRVIHDIVVGLGGSISAEHGIGRAKRDEFLRLKDPVAVAMMRAVKSALDPQGLMNPGKLIGPSGTP